MVHRFIALFLVSTFAAVSCRLFIIENFSIASNSMYPTLWNGDLLLVSKLDYNLRVPLLGWELAQWRVPERGDVVAFTLAGHRLDTFVKRVVGIPGDTIEISKGILFINRNPVVTEPENNLTIPVIPGERGAYFAWETLSSGPRHLIQLPRDLPPDYGPIDVPKRQLFVLGDNRADSVDSRTWGPIPTSSLKGSPRVVWGRRIGIVR